MTRTVEIRPFTCEQCGGQFMTDRPDEEAQQEALAVWGRRGDAPGMGIVCSACYREILKRERDE